MEKSISHWQNSKEHEQIYFLCVLQGVIHERFILMMSVIVYPRHVNWVPIPCEKNTSSVASLASKAFQEIVK